MNKSNRFDRLLDTKRFREPAKVQRLSAKEKEAHKMRLLKGAALNKSSPIETTASEPTVALYIRIPESLKIQLEELVYLGKKQDKNLKLNKLCTEILQKAAHRKLGY